MSTNLQISFRKSHENWGQNNKPFKIIKKNKKQKGLLQPASSNRVKQLRTKDIIKSTSFSRSSFV